MGTKFSFFILIAMVFVACTNDTKSPDVLQSKMAKAISYNDYYTAIYYAHELLDLDNKVDSTAFQLVELYLITKNYAGAIKMANELLPNANAERQKQLWKIKADAFSKSRDYASAITAYDTLVHLDKDKELDCLYEIGVLYFQGRSIQKGMEAMQKVIANPLSRTTMTTIRSDWGEDKVPYYLAALNYIGYVQIETKKFLEAEAIYEEIVQAKIPFKLAEGNMKLLEQRKAQLTKQAAK
ncbi:MAG: hypothetical protein GY810_30175 [Aureispira sp.]|nr:hypothetical protein [Aureispira sp.]